MGAFLRSAYAFVARFFTNPVFDLPHPEDEGHQDFGDLGAGDRLVGIDAREVGIHAVGLRPVPGCVDVTVGSGVPAVGAISVTADGSPPNIGSVISLSAANTTPVSRLIIIATASTMLRIDFFAVPCLQKL